MCSKNSLVFILAMIFAATVYADHHKALPIPPATTGFYAGIYSGVAYRDWENLTPFQIYLNGLQGGGPPFGDFLHGESGPATGVLMGYQWNNYFAAEVGWNRLATLRYLTPNGVTAPPNRFIKIRSTSAYLGLKFIFPIYEALYMNTKILAMYFDNRDKRGFVPVSGEPNRSDHWLPAAAMALEYYITLNWSINIQYLFSVGFANRPNNDAILRKFGIPNLNLLTLGINYKFVF